MVHKFSLQNSSDLTGWFELKSMRPVFVLVSRRHSKALDCSAFTLKTWILTSKALSRQEVCIRGCFAVQESVLRLLTLGTIPNQEAQSAGALRG